LAASGYNLTQITAKNLVSIINFSSGKRRAKPPGFKLCDASVKLSVVVGGQLHKIVSIFTIIIGVCILLFGNRAGSYPAAAAPPNQLPDIDLTVAEVVAGGFSVPVQVTHAGDNSGRLFVVEQGGRIKIIKNGAVLSTPFLNIASLVSCCGERGLLSVAFHPRYKTNGYFFVNYTNTGGHTVVARYSVSANADVANAASAQVILTVNQPYSNHNGGQLMFGPDDYLYIGMGDGGSGGDPLNHGQNKTTLLGAMLRLDVDHGLPYTIPPDNPYVGLPGRDEIWAIGLRNPWRFSFDRLTGDLYIGDVGQNAWEEIDFQAAGTPGGVNYGWRCLEGTHTYNYSGSCGSEPLTAPIAEYSHSLGHSVSGGFVYRGSLYPALQGRYFYADFVDRKIWSLYQTDGGGWSAPALEINDTGFNISGFGENESGELFVVDYSGGAIRRVADVRGPSPNLTASTKSASTPHANVGEAITYTISLINGGALTPAAMTLVDTIPAGLGYLPGSFSATGGSPDDSLAPTLRWSGSAATGRITLTYRVTVTGQSQGSLVNRAVLTVAGLSPISLTGAVFVPRPVLTSTLADFFLPGTQPHQLTDAIAEADGCNFCHTDPIYQAWRGSMMGQAGRDPLFWAAVAVANQDAPGSGDFCLRCHTPKGWLEGRSHPGDGSALQFGDIDNGVGCNVCHRLVDPVPSTTDEAVAVDAAIRAALTTTLPANHPGSAMLIIDPEDRRRGPFEVNPDQFHPKATYQPDFLGQAGSAVTASSLCGSCHNIDNPLLSWNAGLGQFWPNQMQAAAPSVAQGDLFPIETTYDEWLNSDFATGGVVLPKFAGAKADGRVESCQDCHMPRATGLAAESQFNPVNRDCQSTGCLPVHELVGGNTWVPQLLQDPRWRLTSPPDAAALQATSRAARAMLQKAATLTVTLTDSGAGKTAVVRVENDTGHKLPTGYPEGRRMWLNLRAFDAEGQVIYESGAYNSATAELTEDAAIKIYEAKQGITPELAVLTGQLAGPSFHFVLNNTIEKDNRIPPRGYTQVAYNRPGLQPVGATYLDGQYWDETGYPVPPETVRVAATLYYQTSSRAYIDFLRANGGVDGASLGELWDASKSQPEVMSFAVDPPLLMYFPLIFNGAN
jgi:uncharacterized repeat protein (TIGR01451 family)